MWANYVCDYWAQAPDFGVWQDGEQHPLGWLWYIPKSANAVWWHIHLLHLPPLMMHSCCFLLSFANIIKPWKRFFKIYFLHWQALRTNPKYICCELVIECICISYKCYLMVATAYKWSFIKKTLSCFVIFVEHTISLSWLTFKVAGDYMLSTIILCCLFCVQMFETAKCALCCRNMCE